jgi:hypothetical protein
MSTTARRTLSETPIRSVAAQRAAGHLGDLAGHLHAGRAAAHENERQPAPAPFRVTVQLRRLKAARIRRRTASALSSDFTSSAACSHRSCPKYE